MFKDGVPQGIENLRDMEEDEDTGTMVRFWPDGDTFETTEFDYSTVRSVLENLAYLNPDVKFTIQDLRKEDTVQDEFLFEEGISEFVVHLNEGKEELGVPFISGETPHDRRDELFEQLRDGERSKLIISRVGDEGIDIPNIDLCVIYSTLGSSSSQTAQRIGRTMRPTGSSRGVLLATKGSTESDFVRSSTEYLAEQGIEVEVTER